MRLGVLVNVDDAPVLVVAGSASGRSSVDDGCTALVAQREVPVGSVWNERITPQILWRDVLDEPHAILGNQEDVTVAQHCRSVDRKDDRRAVSGAHGCRSLLVD